MGDDDVSIPDHRQQGGNGSPVRADRDELADRASATKRRISSSSSVRLKDGVYMLCPRGDLNPHDTGCDLAIEAVNVSHAGAGWSGLLSA